MRTLRSATVSLILAGAASVAFAAPASAATVHCHHVLVKSDDGGFAHKEVHCDGIPGRNDVFVWT